MSEEDTYNYPTMARGRYQIKRCIGKGGLAAVFKCFDTTLKVHRAVKVLRPDLVARGNMRERFSIEAQAMASLDHPNIVHVYDHGNDGPALFIVMEYLPHNSLQQYLDVCGPLSKEQAVCVCLDIASALQRAHDQGVIHRDIKPDNILLSPQGAKLSDFGLARINTEDQQITRTHAVMGTFPFMAPEQRLSAKKTNHQSDIYALTASLFVMLTNRDPSDLYDKEERDALLTGIEPVIARILARGCESSLEDRYAQVSELIEDLEDLGVDRAAANSSLGLLDAEQGERLFNKQDLTQLLSVWSDYTTGVEELAPGSKLESRETINFEQDWDDEPQVEPQRSATPDTQPKPSPTSNTTTDIVQTAYESIAPAPRSKKRWIAVIGVVSALFFVRAMMTESSPEEAEPAAVVTDLDSIHPPDWNYQGVFLLTAPKDESAQKQFIAARRALLNGEFPLAERLLAPLSASHSDDPSVHALLALIHFFRGRTGLSAAESSSTAKLSRDLKTPLGEIFQLTDRSWRERDNAANLLPRWDELRANHPDPIVEILYLTSTRDLKRSDGFLASIRKARQAHPDWVVLVSLELFALQRSGDIAEMRTVADAAMGRFPAATGLLLAKGEAQYQLGELEEAEATMKQVLMLDSNLIAARSFLAGIYIAQNNEAARLEQLMIAMSDTTTPFERLAHLQQHAHHLVNHGQLAEAEKLWNFCLEEAHKAGDHNRRLKCASEALDGLKWLKPASEWNRWIVQTKEILAQSGFEADLRRFYTIRLSLAQAMAAARQGQIDEAKQIMQQEESVHYGDLALGMREGLSGTIRFEIALIEKDREGLESLMQTHPFHTQNHAQQKCFQPFREARVSRALDEADQMEAALRRILADDCIHDLQYKGMLLARTRAWLAATLISQGNVAEAQTVLEAHRDAWPAADADLDVTALGEPLAVGLSIDK